VTLCRHPRGYARRQEGCLTLQRTAVEGMAGLGVKLLSTHRPVHAHHDFDSLASCVRLHSCPAAPRGPPDRARQRASLFFGPRPFVHLLGWRGSARSRGVRFSHERASHMGYANAVIGRRMGTGYHSVVRDPAAVRRSGGSV